MIPLLARTAYGTWHPAFSLKDGPQAGCVAHQCKILVLSFAVPAGIDPLYGSQLADDLTKRLADLQKEVQFRSQSSEDLYGVANLPSGFPKSDENAREFARGLGPMRPS
jgi:hypothetical protein